MLIPCSWCPPSLYWFFLSSTFQDHVLSLYSHTSLEQASYFLHQVVFKQFPKQRSSFGVYLPTQHCAYLVAQISSNSYPKVIGYFVLESQLTFLNLSIRNLYTGGNDNFMLKGLLTVGVPTI